MVGSALKSERAMSDAYVSLRGNCLHEIKLYRLAILHEIKAGSDT